MIYRAECDECDWTSDEKKTMNAAAREVDEHRRETGHSGGIEREF